MDTAKLLKEKLDPSIKTIGVFVNEEIKNIITLYNHKSIDLIQLHGEEDEEYIKKLRHFIPAKIIKAVRVKNVREIILANELSCDYLLLDAYNKVKYGGSGETFDWSVITNMGKPYFLAGGIHSGNVKQAMKQCNPYCIDVSSGVETDGFKDPYKIIDIVGKVRKS